MIQLLYFSCWVTARYQKSAILSVKVGKSNQNTTKILGAPTFIKNYFPGNKIHVFDTVKQNLLPTIQITFNQAVSKSFTLPNYLNHQVEPHVQIVNFLQNFVQFQDFQILFTFQLLNDTSKLYDKCTFNFQIDCNQKQQTEKHYLCEGLKDFIRSQQQFLAQFQRNQQISEFRQLQAQESRIQKDLCEEIINTKKYTVSFTKNFLVIIIFFFVGFIIAKNDESRKGNIIRNLFFSDKNHNSQVRTQNKKYKKKIQGKLKKRKVGNQGSKQKTISQK